MKRDTEVEAVITRSLSAAEIMDLTGHNKGSLYQILDRLIRENKIKSSSVPTPLICLDCESIGVFNLNCGRCRLRILNSEPCKVLRQQTRDLIFDRYGEPDGDWKGNNCGCERTCQRRANRRESL
jgi:hypothetical protein